MDGSALSCECLLMNSQGSEDSVRRSSKVQGLQDFTLLCCYFTLECNISTIPGIASWFCTPLDKIQASFLLNLQPIFLLLSVSMLFPALSPSFHSSSSWLQLSSPSFSQPVSPHISLGLLPLIKHSCRALRKAPLLFRIVI